MIFHYKISRPRPATLLKEKNSKKTVRQAGQVFSFLKLF